MKQPTLAELKEKSVDDRWHSLYRNGLLECIPIAEREAGMVDRLDSAIRLHIGVNNCMMSQQLSALLAEVAEMRKEK